MRIIWGLYFAALVLSGAVAAAAERNWTTKDGSRIVRGSFVDVSDGRVWLRTKRGEQDSLPLAELSPSDVEYLRRQKLFVADSDVETVLQTRTITRNFGDQLLTDAIRRLASDEQLPIFLDEKSLAEGGIDLKRTLTVQVTNQPVEVGLRAILAPLGLEFSVTSAGAVVITTKDGLPRYGLRTHVYRVLGAGPAAGLQLIRQSLREKVTPESWRSKGGPANYKALQLGPLSAVVVIHTYAGHREIQRQYAGTLKCIRTQIPTPIQALGLQRSLVRNVDLALDGIQLGDFPLRLNNDYHLNVTLDEEAVKQAGVPLDLQLHAAAKGRLLRECLDIVLQPLGLTWTLDRDGTVLLTTPEVASQKLLSLDHRFANLLPNLPARQQELTQLIEAIQIGCLPRSWQAFGGYAKISTDGFLRLTVTHTVRGHLAIHELLSRLSAAAREP